MTIPFEAIKTALVLLPESMNTKEAVTLMVAIGLQESRFKHRKQIGGPARGYWQFESGGGVKGVMHHRSSNRHAKAVCDALEVPWDQNTIYNTLAENDVLAAAFARLLLWTDPRSVPAIGAVTDSWDYYIRNWRPGKPHIHTWAELYDQAVTECEYWSPARG